MGRPGPSRKANAYSTEYLHQEINERCKTANSRKTVPLHELQIAFCWNVAEFHLTTNLVIGFSPARKCKANNHSGQSASAEIY